MFGDPPGESVGICVEDTEAGLVEAMGAHLTQTDGPFCRVARRQDASQARLNAQGVKIPTEVPRYAGLMLQRCFYFLQIGRWVIQCWYRVAS